MRTLIASAILAAGLAAVPAPSQALPAWHVSMSPLHATVVLGHQVHFSGHVTASAAGRHVKLMQRNGPGSDWHLQRYAKVQDDGSYKTWDTPTTTSTRQYRVVMPTTRTHRYGTSETATVQVMSWRALTDQTYLNNRNVSVGNTVSFGGTSYVDSIVAGSWSDGATPAAHQSSVEFNLDYRCTKIRGTAGLADYSLPDSAGGVRLTADNVQIYQHDFAPGDTQSIAMPLGQTLKLRIELTSTVPGEHAYAGIGHPEVLCHD